jgi:hypothetical protein
MFKHFFSMAIFMARLGSVFWISLRIFIENISVFLWISDFNAFFTSLGEALGESETTPFFITEK